MSGVFSILILNQKGGVGKTTVADELAFALERRERTVAFATMDAQGGSIHKVSDIGGQDYRVIDTPGYLGEDTRGWSRSADLILIPTLPSTRDLEPTLRTYDIAASSGTKARICFILNRYNANGVLDRRLMKNLEKRGHTVIATVAKTVALEQAAAMGMSVAEYDERNQVVGAFDELAGRVVSMMEGVGVNG